MQYDLNPVLLKEKTKNDERGQKKRALKRRTFDASSLPKAIKERLRKNPRLALAFLVGFCQMEHKNRRWQGVVTSWR